MGIHLPKNLNEAYLARRRLIFDEFFYLQVIVCAICHIFQNNLNEADLACRRLIFDEFFFYFG